ncbi:MAG: chemotaxis protein CheB [Ferruginibacter sp.]
MSKADTGKPVIISKNLFPVVGIGASAGGLEAFKNLVKAIPENSGMAYILVQHLHPEHESALPEILQRFTHIPVVEISDNVHVDPNHIYVIPSNKLMVATDGILKLSPRLAKQNLPINIFFSSLAEVHQGHSIGVVLSGTGGDGTAGLKDIKDQGGLTFAQDPASAAYDGMPQHAIDAQVVDFILTPEKMPQKLMELQQSFNNLAAEDEIISKDKTIEDAFRQILAMLRVRVGVDFSYYKQTTVRRRITRRLLMLNLETITEYLEHLKKNKTEQDILFNDLLIPVTSFFRDPLTFDTLCETVIPEITKNKSVTDPLRIWIAGCSTGQEAYSMAICLHEYLSDHIANIKVQIFATDLSEKAIKIARSGTYTKKETEGLSETRLEQYFDKTNGQYQVKKQVRDMCVFAVHNFLKDPPFAKMDFISCRNVLIYLEPFLQKKALTIFHYALNDKAILLLGKSETTGNAADLFIDFGQKDKLYSRNTAPGRFMNVTSEPRETAFRDNNYLLRSKEGKTEDFQKNADDILLQKYTPVGVVVNEQFDIVQFRGATGQYLEPSPGKASLNVLKMAREGLSFEIRNALHKAKTTSEPFIKEAIPINEGKKLVTIEVVPLLNTIDLHFLILFRGQPPISNEQLATGKEKSLAAKTRKDEKDARIAQLEKELGQAREDMRSITEEQEAANEELQSSNEELLSGGEELQSLNEELETSKEELQSTNEELITVNQELYDRNEEVSQSRKFAEATLAVLHEPLLVMDKNFDIKSVNKSFYKIFQLTEDDILGKSLFTLQQGCWDTPALRKELENIQKEKEKTIEMEIVFLFPEIGERNICVNLQLLSRESGEQLILLALDDISLQKKAEKVLEEKAKGVAKEYEVLHGFLMEAPALFAILKGPDHVFEFANTLYHQFTGNRNIIGKKLIVALPEVMDQGFLEILDKVYTTGQPYVGREMLTSMETQRGKWQDHYVNFNYEPILDNQGQPEGILVFAYDVTEIVQGRKHLQRNAKMIQDMYMNAPAYVATLMGPDHVYELVNPSYQKLFGARKITGKPILVALPELVGQGFDRILDNVYNTGEIFLGNEVLIRLAYDEGLEPAERYFNFSYQPIYDEDNKIIGVLVFGYEVTDEIKGRKIQEESAARFGILTNAMPQKMWMADELGNVNYLNQQWFTYTQKSFDELKGLGWEKIIHPDDWNHNKQTWLNSISTGDDFELQHRFLKYDGTYHWHLSRGHAQKDDTGKVIVWIGTHTDIDEQKIKEQKKDEFISIASHEMKTPLTTAKAYLQLLELSLDKRNENANLYAKKASQSVTRLNELITELLDVSKIQYGKLNYNIASFDFNDMINNSVEDIQHTTAKHTIIKTGKVQQVVTGDKNRLQQVVNNLLSNAIKYSPDSLDILINVEQANGEIKVSVKDHGLGISKQHLEKIFDRYYRIEEHAIEFQGLGIGLFISYEIIQRHHGKLWAESEAGKGSTFYFTLPINMEQ